MKCPLFSIIIPTYNRAHIIHRPIESILAQTFTDWELIIVDDGSTDDTKAVVDSYPDERIRYVWQENQERSAARNHGIRLAKGEWICFQDSDDEYLTNHLQVLNQGIGDNPNFKVIRTGLFIHENRNFISQSGKKSLNYDPYPFESFTTATFHYTLLKELQFNPQYFISEDLHFLLKIGMKHKMKVLNECTGVYYYDPSSSGGVGIKYQKNLTNQKACLDDILTWNKTLILPYIKRKRCLNEILMLFGHTKYKRKLILKAVGDNIKFFTRFPLEYLKLVIRIVYVKIGESSGLYRTNGRF
ncbi:MAG: glycosyltransferase family 2 protein [Saprospiraceae bacterium]|nr:glycosyltransferase family 2 protein [Saprospiraceae bacterium]